MKKAYIFDLDDTLIRSKSHIYVYNEDNELVDKINSQEYVHKRDIIRNYHIDGYKVETHEFGGNGSCDHADRLSYYCLMEGETLESQIHILRKYVKEENNCDIYVVTGRGNKRQTLHELIKERFDIEIPIEHIYPVSNDEYMEEVRKRFSEEELMRLGSICNFKTNSLYDILRKEYDYVEFYDDDPRNIEAFHQMIHLFKNTKYKTYLIQE